MNNNVLRLRLPLIFQLPLTTISQDTSFHMMGVQKGSHFGKTNKFTNAQNKDSESLMT